MAITKITIDGTEYELMAIPKTPERTKLFTTEDGVKVFEGDGVWCINGVWSLFVRFIISKEQYLDLKGHCKFFKDEEKGEEYILMNKPCLSVNDVADWLNKETSYISADFTNLKELAKSKLS